jgi:5-methylcytosine-specific restriction endonuclease McrA
MSNRSANASTRRWRKVRGDQLRREPWCACGQPATEVHHRHALADGGARFDPANLVSVCGACHVRTHGHRPRPAVDPRTGLPTSHHWWADG